MAHKAESLALLPIYRAEAHLSKKKTHHFIKQNLLGKETHNLTNTHNLSTLNKETHYTTNTQSSSSLNKENHYFTKQRVETHWARKLTI